MNDPMTPQPTQVLLDVSLREPLAVLLLCSDILREHGGRLTAERLVEQKQAMQAAAGELAQAIHKLSVAG